VGAPCATDGGDVAVYACSSYRDFSRSCLSNIILDRNCDSKHGYKAYNGYSHVRTCF